jgi:hypothetical protein
MSTAARLLNGMLAQLVAGGMYPRSRARTCCSFITLSNSLYGTVVDIPGMLESVVPFLGAEVLASTEQCVVHRETKV